MELDEFEPPQRPDFRRVGKGIPFVVGLDGKRVRYSRSSSGGKILDDESNLTDWKARTIVAGAAQRPELMAEASTLDVDIDKKRLRDIAEECLVAGRGQRRAIIGNAVHAMFDHLDRRDGWVPPPNFVDLCDAYTKFLGDWGLEVIDIEAHCINDEFRLAGTLDRRYRTTKLLVAPDGTVIPIGSVLVSDHKTGKELEYASGSYCTQAAAYVGSVRYDVVTDERTPFDPPHRTDWSLIVHADSAGTEIHVYWVDLEAGRMGLRLAGEVKAWRRRADLLTPATFTPPAAPVVPEPVAPVDVPTAPAVGRSPGPEPTDRAEYLRARVRALMDYSDVAARSLQRAWPVGVPGLKAGGHSDADLDAIEAVLVKVEADHSVPFFKPFRTDLDESKMRHPSNINKPRFMLMNKLLGIAAEKLDDISDVEGISKIIGAFTDLPEDEWPDSEVEVLLTGALRGVGFGGLTDLGAITKNHTHQVLTLLFAINAGTAKVLFNEQDEPIVRVLS